MNKLAIYDFVILIISISIFQFSYTNPTILGIRYLNHLAGGNDVIVNWANNIMQMPIEDITDDDLAVKDYLNVKESFYRNQFNNVSIERVMLLKHGVNMCVQIYYGDGGNVYIGDENLIKSKWNPQFSDGDLFIEYMIK